MKFEPLMQFLKQQSGAVDIFCFQEVRNGEYYDHLKEAGERENLFQEMEKVLVDFKGYYSEMMPGVGMATFIRSNIAVEKVEAAQILRAEEIAHIRMADGSIYYPRVIQSIYLKDTNRVIYNFHGIPGMSKKDTPERDLQTKRLLALMAQNTQPHIIVGDFNLDINTEAISTLGQSLRNLIKESNFKTTRNRNYNSCDVLPFADYAFVSPEIKINNFLVLPDEISDHLALLLDFN